jgi:hypothetical protein
MGRDEVLVFFLALFLLALAIFMGRGMIACVRRGAFTNRGGLEISRREDPFLFWMGIFMWSVAALMPLVVGLWIFWQLGFSGE